MAAPLIAQAEILGRVKTEIDAEVAALREAYEKASLPAVAWIARSLLELAVWTKYCVISEENANRFVSDAIRDTFEALELAAQISPNPNEFIEAKAELLKTATGDGFEDLDSTYKWVAIAAKEIGMGEQFRQLNKLFSKFAHPTAIRLFSNRGEYDAKLIENFYGVGMAFATLATNLLIDWQKRRT